MTINDYYRQFSEEIGELKNEVYQKTDGKISAPTKEYLCCYYLLEHLKSLHDTEDYDCFQQKAAWFWDSQGRNLGEIHGYMLIKNPNEEESYQLQLFYVIYADGVCSENDIPMVSQQEFDTAVDRVTGYYEKVLVKGNDVQEFSSHYHIANWIYYNQNKISQIVINIVSNNIVKSQTIIKKNDKGSRGKTVILNENNIYDINHLYRIFCENSGRDSINVKFANKELPCVISKQENTGYESFLAVLPGTVVYDLYDTYQNELLENNVRLFLGVKEAKKNAKKTSKRRKKVNDEIRETLVERPHMFLAYNNGLAVTCSNVEIETFDGKLGYIKRIEDFQIVNGGQTTVSIYLAKKANPNLDLGSVFVQMKLTKVEDQSNLADEVTAISVCSNRQNEVKFTDFSANNAFYRELESLINRDYKLDPRDGIQKRWYFERKTNSYSQELAHSLHKAEFKIKTPKEHVFKKEVMAQVHMSWLNKPYLCSSSYAACFTQYAKYIDEASIEPDKIYAQDTIALLILYTEITNSRLNSGNRKGLLTLFSLAMLKKKYPQFSLYKIYNMRHVPDDLLDQILLCSTAMRILLRDELKIDDIRNGMKSEDDYNKICQKIRFDFDDSIISKYLKDKSEDANRKNIPMALLPTIDDHELVISFGRRFWSYMRDINSPMISRSISDSICDKIFDKQILSDAEVNSAVLVCKYYQGNKDIFNYIETYYSHINNGESYEAINIAHMIMEENNTSWDAKIEMMERFSINTTNMNKIRSCLLKGEYTKIKYEDLLRIKTGLDRCKTMVRIN